MNGLTIEPHEYATMTTIPPSPFILVDGSSYLFRAYHALPPLSNSKGQPTGAIYGVISMLKKLMIEYTPSKMAVIFDSKEKNFRHALYEPYKANRTIMPDELQVQIAPLHALIKAMGIPLMVVPGVEADDVIGTLAKQATQAGLFTLISTGDKDFAQLVSDEHIMLINTMSNTLFDRQRVIEKFEVSPELMVDYLSLIGDSVDNVPGIPKVGPKTAVKWLNTYQSLDNLIAHADEIPGKVGENLRDNLSLLPLYKELVTIQTDADIPMNIRQNLEYFTLTPSNSAELMTLYAELEFKNWLKALDNTEVQNTGVHETPSTSSMPSTYTPHNADYETVLTTARLEYWIKRLQEANLFALDIETTHLNYMSAEIVGISFAIQPHQAVYLPFSHDYMGAPLQLTREFVLSQLKPLLENPTLLKVGQNIKYTLEVLENHDIDLQGIAFDTLLESYILNSTSGRHNMDTLATRVLHYKTISYESVAGKGVKQLPFNQVPLEIAGPYAAESADIILQVHHAQWSKLSILPKQKKVFENIEMPLIPVLARMERKGVLIDAKRMAEHSIELQQHLQKLENEICILAGQPFNINSPKQLQEILFVKLGLPMLEKTPGGQPATSEPVLQELAHTYALPKLILQYRSLSKLKSTYTDALLTQIHFQTGRIHPCYQQTVTATGRLSCSDPNLQNIPIRSLEGRKIRAAFIAPPGKKIVAADYSQIELRIMAHLSQDAGLLHAFTQQTDIHKSTASEVFGVSLEAVSSEQRRKAKIINFGLMYGMSIFGLAKQLDLSQEEAQTTLDRYFNCFPGVKHFMEKTKREAFEQGFVETLTGRRLYLPELHSNKMTIRKGAERAAINAPMQGTNADIIKLAMIQLDRWILEEKLDMHMIMQVHDELVFEIEESAIPLGIAKIREIMENVVKLSVKLEVNIGVGDNWEAAH